MGHDILFDAAGFNFTEPRDHFINPECFGDDVAAWLAAELTARGFPTTEPGQEDWGWYVEVTTGPDCYFVGVGCTGATDADPAKGEWRLMVEKHRTLWQKLTGKNQPAADEPIFAELERILVSNRDVTNVRRG